MSTYREEDFPHGLRCIACDRLFVEGQPIAERLLAFQDDIPIVELACVPCGIGLTEEAA